MTEPQPHKIEIEDGNDEDSSFTETGQTQAPRYRQAAFARKVGALCMAAIVITGLIPYDASPFAIICFTATLVVGQWMALRGVPIDSGHWSGASIMMSIAFAFLLALYAKGCVEYLIRIEFDATEIYWFWRRNAWN